MATLYMKENILEFRGYYYNYNNNYIYGISKKKPLSNSETCHIKLSDLRIDENTIKNTPLWKELFDANINSRYIFIFNRLFIIKNYYILENPYSKFIIQACGANVLVTIEDGYISSYETILSISDNIKPILSVAWLSIENILVRLVCHKLTESIIDFNQLDEFLLN